MQYSIPIFHTNKIYAFIVARSNRISNGMVLSCASPVYKYIYISHASGYVHPPHAVSLSRGDGGVAEQTAAPHAVAIALAPPCWNWVVDVPRPSVAILRPVPAVRGAASAIHADHRSEETAEFTRVAAESQSSCTAAADAADRDAERFVYGAQCQYIRQMSCA